MSQAAVWYFDVISPYAYLSLPQLDAIRARRDLVLKPVVFGALLKHWGQLGPAEIAPKRIHLYRQIVFEAARNGLPLRFPDVHPFRPLPLLRLLTAVKGDQHAVEAAFRLVWGHGRDATAEDTLLDIAKAAGQPEAVHKINDEAIKARLHWNTDEAAAAGAFGVPTLLIDGEVFWGADAIPMALAFLDNPDLFKSGEYTRATELRVGVVRDRGQRQQ